MTEESRVRSFGVTDVGRVRDHNEDRFLIDEGLGLFAVADGMGGHAAGEVAAETACRSLETYLSASLGNTDITWPFGVDGELSLDGNCLKTAIRLANRRVVRAADDDEKYAGMGSTVVVALIRGGKLIVAGVGDSRVYLYRDGAVQQLTRDDSFMTEEWVARMLKPEEIAKHPLRNVLTKSLGMHEPLEFEIRESGIGPGESILLCSDGLTAHLNEEEIAAIVTAAGCEPQAVCEALLAEVLERGARDNVTLVFAAVTK